MVSSIVNPLVSLAGTIPGFISSRLMAAYNVDGLHTIHVATNNVTGDGRLVWHYVLTCGDEFGVPVVIFEGYDLTTPITATYGDVARTALDLVTLRPGDTDAEYFEGYTPAQIEWRDEFAEDLAMFGMGADD